MTTNVARLPLVEECTFGARVTNDGMFVGYVEQFPDIRTRPCPNRLDAIDDVITRTSDKLRRLAAAADDRKVAPR